MIRRVKRKDISLKKQKKKKKEKKRKKKKDISLFLLPFLLTQDLLAFPFNSRERAGGGILQGHARCLFN